MASIVLEVGATTCMKLSAGFTRLGPTLMTGVLYLGCFLCFVKALEQWELSAAYAIWSGLGTALTAVIGFAAFGDSINSGKIVSILVIIAGVAGLHFFS